MPDNESTFDPGADLTPTFGANAALIEQAIELATPNSYRGLIIYSETTPATTGQPSGYPSNWYEWHKRCIWFKPSTGEFFQFNGTTWALGVAKPGAGVITNAMIANGTIQFGKLSVTGGAALQILQINNLGTAWAFVDVANAIAANSVAISKIIGGSTGVKVLLSSSGTNSWTAFDSATIINLFNANEFPSDYITRGSSDQILTTNTAGTAISWRAISSLIADYSLAITKIARQPALAGLTAIYDATGALTGGTASSGGGGGTASSYTATAAVPAANTTSVFAHGMSSIPDFVEVTLVCTAADAGYAIGAKININSVTAMNGFSSDDSMVAFTSSFDATNIRVTLVSNWTPYTVNGTTGALTSIDLTKWNISVRAYIAVASGTGVNVVVSTGVAVPANGAVAATAHTQSSIPHIVSVTLVAVNAVAGYSIGNEADISTVYTSGVGDIDGLSAFSIATDATNVTVIRQNAATPFIRNKSGSGVTAFVGADWTIKIVTALYDPTVTSSGFAGAFASIAEVVAGATEVKAISPATAEHIPGLVKASANVTISTNVGGVTVATLVEGINIASVAIVAGAVRFTFTNALPTTTYAAVIHCQNTGVTSSYVANRATTTVDVFAFSAGLIAGHTLNIIIV